MDKNQLKILREASETARKIKESYFLDLGKLEAIKPLDFQIPLLAKSISEIIRKIDFSHIIPKLVPKIDYYQLMKNYQFFLPKLDPLVLTQIYNLQVSSLQKIALDFTRIQVSDLAKVRANGLLMTASIESIRNIKELNNSFAVELASTIYRIIENSDTAEDNFSEFNSLVETRTKDQPTSKASLELILFILTFLSFLASSGQLYYSKLQYDDSQHSSEINDQRYSEFIKILSGIAENLDEKSDINKTNYLVQRTIELKVKPNFKSTTIAFLYPNQRVQLIQSSHKWIYVEYFDYLDGIPKYGWANKKYLIRLEESK